MPASSRALCVFLTWPWPSNSGGRIRAAGIVDALGADHEVTVLSSDRSESGFLAWDEAVERIRRRRASPLARSRDIVEGILAGDHTVSRRARHAGLERAFAEVLREIEPGLVVLDRPFFGGFIDRARTAGAAIAIDADERLALVARSTARAPHVSAWSRARAVVEAMSLDRMERREYPRADAIWVGSRREERNFRGVVPTERLHVVPNVVPPIGARRCDGSLSAVAFVGWYGHPPNEAAALELIRLVMPAIRAAGGPERLILIGREPTARMRSAAARAGQVDITGEVDDVQSLLCQAGLLVLPIRAGGGTRIKVLEAAALGVPIVATGFAVFGLGLEPGVHYLGAETPAEFAAAAARLHADEELRARLTAAARDAVLLQHGPDAVLRAVRAGLARS